MIKSNEATIEQMNKAIGEFMGLEKDLEEWRYPKDPLVFLINGYWTPVRKLKYHNSWDWLMPVIKSIKSMTQYDMWGEQMAAKSRWKPIVNELQNLDLTNTHYCAYKFIEWYSTVKF